MTILGTDNDDLLVGDDNGRYFIGGYGVDTMRGGAGADTFMPGAVTEAQADVIEGGAGDDTYQIEDQFGAGTVSFDGGSDTDTLELINGYDGSLIDITGMTIVSVEVLRNHGHTVRLTGGQAQAFAHIEGDGRLAIFGSSDLSGVSLFDRKSIDLLEAGSSITLDKSALDILTTLTSSGFNASLIISDPLSWSSSDLRTLSLSGFSSIVAHGSYLTLNLSAAQFSEILSITMDGAANSALKVYAASSGSVIDLNRAGLSGIGQGIMVGGAGVDTLRGGAGNDVFSSEGATLAQADVIEGGAGNDAYHIAVQADAGTVTFDGGSGTDRLVSGSANPIDITGMTLTSVEVLDLFGSNTHALTMTGAQAESFSTITGGGGQDSLTIVGSADLAAKAMTRIESIASIGVGATLTLTAAQLVALTAVSITDPTGVLQVSAAPTGGLIDLSRVGLSGVGHSIVRGGAGLDTLRGGAGDDVFQSAPSQTAQSDAIEGGAGSDRYQVVRQHDAGAVRFDGGAGIDTLEIATSSPLDVSGMTLTSVEVLELSGGQDHNVTLTGIQVEGFTTLMGGTGIDELTIAGSADLSALSMFGVDTINLADVSSTLSLSSSQLSGLSVTGAGAGNSLVVGAAGLGVAIDVSAAGLAGFGQIGVTGSTGDDTITVGGAGNITVTGGDGADAFHIAGTTTGSVTILDAAVGDRLLIDGLTLSGTMTAGTGADLLAGGMEAETIGGNTVLHFGRDAVAGADLSVTLIGAFDLTQFQFASGGLTFGEAVIPPPPPPPPPPSVDDSGSLSPSPVPSTGTTLEPSGGFDRLIGSDGNDYLFSNHRNVAFDGKGGVDVVRIHGLISQYRVDVLDQSTVTTTPLYGLEGVDTLQGVELLQFDDGVRLANTPSLEFFYDESAYLALNPDVAAAVRNGSLASGLDHYVQYGEAEGRGLSFVVDENFYRAQNPDVNQAIVEGHFQSGTEHFVLYGNRENRAPSALFDPSWYLMKNPDVATVVESGITTAYKHFGECGWREGRDPSPWFDCSEYNMRYPDVAASGVNPLLHFVAFGQTEGRVAMPVDLGMWV